MTVAEIFDSLDYGPAPESSQQALEWLEAHHRTFGNFIDGRWTEPQSSERFETFNPASGESLGSLAQSGQDDVSAAVEAARRAGPNWSSLPGHRRARFLYAIARQIQKNSRLLAVLETLDNGKTIRETRDIDVPLVARHFYYHAGWAQLFEEEFPDFEPVGVAAQIIPWNFPLLMLAWKIAPALAMGNTVVLKPAEFTSLTALAFAEIVDAVGLPPGVVNVITGDGATGEMLVNSPVDKIAFTGSTEVGRAIRRATAGSGKRLSLELGGKSPFVVFDDADLDSAVEGIVDAIWFNQGQVCCAGSRLLVQEDIADAFLERVRRRMETLRIGDPLDKAMDIGAIVAPVQLQRIQHLVEQGVEEGAKMWQPSWACPTEGYFYPPTLFTDVSPSATIAQVEIFGPVLVSMTFRTPAEAVELANNTTYGLAASVWSENINLALDVARQVKAGTIWINCTNMFDAASGFGGYRESGFGREGGVEGLYEYLKPKSLSRSFSVDSSDSMPQPATDSLEDPYSSDDDGMIQIDRTPKQYIGGKQVRADSGYSLQITNPTGLPLGEVGAGNRKDIRDAVEAAHKASSWGSASAHTRAQILYYIAENLSARRDEFARRIRDQVHGSIGEADTYLSSVREVDQTIERLFTFAAWTDKYDGYVHQTPFRNMTIAVNEPIGVIGFAAPDDYPLLAFTTALAAAISMGNTVVALPSARHPLSATDLYQVFDTSDLPPGVVNIVTGDHGSLLPALSQHDDVDAMWCWGTREECSSVEFESAGNMKRTWVHHGRFDWERSGSSETGEFLREATQVKNIWTPYGE